MERVKELSAGTLAFVGDAVFGLMVREKLAETNRPSGELHKKSVEYVNANAQAEGFEVIKDMLNEEELTAFKHGRNLHTNNVPKNSSLAQYHAATGLEALFGYLHLSKKEERLKQLFEKIWLSKAED
ncbi:MAG: ribonuclease III [Clostridia bacterium]|nr:ribonuclease III [Clostridia bacterium]